ncbi:outer membrane protein TolC [Ancylomarina subtilis]|uniref:Outer membrane protein TolC n=1 Tax=Ancylomarina subtilis TaxID=1639035 RepID=A0A4Q7VHJ0_9BACT|nr:TolC family protein [Ancylomarina subtilis]RZT95517.1 outer membrane protein TolC [Ancylomarina subtilis]
MNSLLKNSKYTLLLALIFHFQIGWTQEEVLSLEQCQKEVQENFPLVKGKDLLTQSSQLNIENLKTSYLPRLYANGKLSYQSDVTGISFPGMITPQAPKDQYALNIDIEQLIYDGGKTKDRIELEKKASEVEIQNLEIQLYQLRKRVNDAFFGIQLVRKNKLVLLDKHKTISNRIKQIRSAVENGVLLPANLKVMESELLLIDQQIQELHAYEATSFHVLSELMGRKIDVNTQLQDSSLSIESINNLNTRNTVRPEYQMYSSQKSLLEAQKELVKKDRYPVISGFGQLGYGNPGYNQLTDQFDTYYMLGAKISWHIFDWKSNRRKQKEITIRKDIVSTQELSFTQNQLIELGNERIKLKKIKILLEKDDAIIDLKKAISASSASQLDNGIITSSDYLDELNKEIQAKLNKAYHLIQLQQSLSEYQRIKGI